MNDWRAIDVNLDPPDEPRWFPCERCRYGLVSEDGTRWCRDEYGETWECEEVDDE
jgi:hypothetical protein